MADDKIKDDIAQLEKDEAANAPGSDTSTAPAADTGRTDPASVASAKASSGDVGAQIDALFDKHFRGTRMGNDTELWNQCMSFREEVKALVTKAA